MKNNRNKKIIAGFSALGLVAAAVFPSIGGAVNTAAILEDGILGGDTSLGRLLILDRLTSDEVTVQSGDTLSIIAQRELGSAARYPEIADLNSIQDPNVIYPGQVLNIPDTGMLQGNNLEDLIILEEIFGTGNLSGGSDLGRYIILDEIMGNSNGNGISGQNNNTLRDLIILEEVFGQGGMSGGDSLERLIILDRLFGDGEGLGGSNLEDLIILEEIFNR